MTEEIPTWKKIYINGEEKGRREGWLGQSPMDPREEEMLDSVEAEHEKLGHKCRITIAIHQHPQIHGVSFVSCKECDFQLGPLAISGGQITRQGRAS